MSENVLITLRLDRHPDEYKQAFARLAALAEDTERHLSAYRPMIDAFKRRLGGIATLRTEMEREWRSYEYGVQELCRNRFPLEVRDQLNNGDPRAGQSLAILLTHLLRIHPNQDTLYAAFWILVRSRKWSSGIKALAVIRYLRIAVWGESRRKRRERLEGDGIDTRLQNEELAYRLDWMDRHDPDPLGQMIRDEAVTLKLQILEEVAEGGTERDREILKLLKENYLPAEIVSELGGKWSVWQAFQRKVLREAERRKNLRSVSSKRLKSA